MPHEDARPRADRIVRLAPFLLGLLVLAGILGSPAPLQAADDGLPENPWYRIEDGEVVVDLWFGYSTTCPHCARAKPWLEALEARTPWLEVRWLQLNGEENAANVELILGLAATIGEQVQYVPAFLFGERLVTGFDEASTTGASLEAALVAYHDSLVALVSPTPTAAPSATVGPSAPPSAAPTPGTTPGPTVGPTPGPTLQPTPTPSAAVDVVLPFVGRIDATSLSLPLLTVVLGGLDAVNPCALSILLFLMAALAGSRDRRRLVLVGGAFVVTIGLVYFVLMAAWLNLFLLAGELRIVTLAAGVAAVLAGLINVKDFGWYRVGPSLVIPESVKPGLVDRMLDVSESVRLPAMLASTVLVAASVSAYEMLCTGGFPVVFTRVLTLSDLGLPAYYAYLGLYVGVYVLPLALIVAAFAITLGTRGVSVNEARRLKLLSGLLMLGLGALLLVAPDRLTDLGVTLLLFGLATGIWLVAVLVDRARQRPPAPILPRGPGG